MILSRGLVGGRRPPRPAVSCLLALLVVAAGCTGTLVEYAASPATIPDAALDQHDYVHGNTTEIPVTYAVGAAGVSRDVTATTWLSGYSRTTAEGDVALLLVYSSPNVVVEGRSVNPLSQLSNRGAAGYVLERVGDLGGLGGVEGVADRREATEGERGAQPPVSGVTDLREAGVSDVTMLGTETELVEYEGVAELEGERVGVVVSVAVVEHGDDVVVALGVHDEALDESATLAALVERIEHEG